jgi:hypothetical protein
MLPDDKKTEIIEMRKKYIFTSQHLRLFLIWGLPFIIAASYLILALQSDLRLAVPTLIYVTGIITILLAVILYAGEKGAVGWSPASVIIIAAVLRILFIFQSPDLSDDLYRYLWDGLQVTSGHNPYAAAPLNVPIQNESSQHLLKLINHPDLITIYPPAAQFIFAVGVYVSHTFPGLKAVLAAFDILTCILIIRLLSSMGLPAWRAAVYAWNPLPILEIASSGHIDGAGILFFILTVSLLISSSSQNDITRLSFPQAERVGNPSSERFRASRNDKRAEARSKIDFPYQFSLKQDILAVSAGFVFSLATLVKFFPLIFLPGLLILVKKQGRILFLTGFLTGAIILTAPFLPDLKNMFTSLELYARNWEFAGFAFRTLRSITSSGNSARLIIASLFFFSATAIYGMLWIKKPSSFRNITQGSLHDSCLACLTPSDKDNFLMVIKTLYAITIAFLFLTPTLYPWYALYLVCFLPFTGGAAGLILTWSVFLSYRVLILYRLLGQWIEDDYTPAFIWLAPALAFLLVVVTQKLRERKQAERPLL